MRFPNNQIAPDYYRELLLDYGHSGLAPPNLVAEILTGVDGKFWSMAWEAMLWRHLTTLGYQLSNHCTKNGQNGPDFCFEHQGRMIWVDAVVPEPTGISKEYLAPPEFGSFVAKTMPDQERVLRCTSVIADKNKIIKRYRECGVIGENDCVVKAVNICRLSEFDPDGCGISQAPLLAEAVLPIGPLMISINRDDPSDHIAHNQWRVELAKGDKTVPSALFLSDEYRAISAVLQGHQKYAIEDSLILQTVRNHRAKNDLPAGLFGASREYLATETPSQIFLTDIYSALPPTLPRT